MDPLDAIRLDNLYPDFGKCTVRKGTRLHCQLATTEPVETVAELLNRKRPVPARRGGRRPLGRDQRHRDHAAGRLLPFDNDRWQRATMNGVLGLANGANTPQTYDGMTKAAMTISGAGLNVADIVGHQRIQEPVLLLDGAARTSGTARSTPSAARSSCSRSPISPCGGTLVSMMTWTRDGGSGLDDFAVFLMTSGEAIVYQGSDPGHADDWALVGVYQVGGPVGLRFWSKFGGDLLVVTADGYGLLSKALPEVRGARGTQVSDKIVNAAIAQVRKSGSLFGWDVLHYPRGMRMMINYQRRPLRAARLNLATGAWCRFLGMDARGWCLFDDAPYFGGAAARSTRPTSASATTARRSSPMACRLSATSARGPQQAGHHGRPWLEGIGHVPVRSAWPPTSTPTRRHGAAALGRSRARHPVGHREVGHLQLGRDQQAIQGWLAHSARGYAISPSLRVEQRDSPISWNATSISYQRVGVT